MPARVWGLGRGLRLGFFTQCLSRLITVIGHCLGKCFLCS